MEKDRYTTSEVARRLGWCNADAIVVLRVLHVPYEKHGRHVLWEAALVEPILQALKKIQSAVDDKVEND